MMKYLRATARAAVGLAAAPLLLGLFVVQGFGVGPITRNYEVLPKMTHKIIRRLLGIRVEFNAASVPIVHDKNKKVWFVANHISTADPIIFGSTLTGSFVGKSDLLKWPIVSQIAKSAKLLGVRRQSKYNSESRGMIARNFNNGFNTIMFPEGTTGDGKRVYLFRAALLGLLFGEKATGKNKKDISLKKKVLVQPVAIRVKSVNGKPVDGNDDLRNLYSLPEETNALRRIWKRMQLRSVVIELTAFPALDPADFDSAISLANKAAADIASVVNPGQITFEKKSIPGLPERKGQAAKNQRRPQA